MTDSSKSEVVLERISYYRKMITDTILSIQRYKQMDVLGANDLNLGIHNLENNYELLDSLESLLEQESTITDKHINILQEVNDNLSVICKNYGTTNIDDILSICFGQSFLQKWLITINTNKYELLQQYFHPTGYKLVNCTKKRTITPIEKNKIVDENKMEEFGENLDCFDLARTNKKFRVRLYGMKVIIFNTDSKKMLILSGVVDDILINCIKNPFLSTVKNELVLLIDEDDIDHHYYRFIKTITLKEWLIYSTTEILHKFKGYDSQMNLLQQKSMTQIINDFMNNDLYSQRSLLIVMLCRLDCDQFKYIAYLLYDLLSNDNNGNIDTTDQTLLYDSLPWYAKTNFKIAMTETIDYTNNLIKFEQNKIPLEQQICLLKTTDSIKEKAMSKLREIKSKSEDSGSKSRQYLDGLLRIPFGVYREEEILTIMSSIKEECTHLINHTNVLKITNMDATKPYNSLQIKNIINTIDHNISIESIIGNIQTIVKTTKRSFLIQLITFINSIIKSHSINTPKLCHSGIKVTTMRQDILTFIQNNSNKIDVSTLCNLLYISQPDSLINMEKHLSTIQTRQQSIKNYIHNVKDKLDVSVYGHDDAKRQIERIIGQWINGEHTGYCFGFEGPPGVGKTSLALNGIAKCLEDTDGTPRPFSIIAMGGSSNGSTLEGHNFTYVGSTWGKIVDILIEKKCMNPIIFIDELDKVSKTEHGREIIGILTHLIDKTQNTHFQDRYFTGIDLDLSRTLFIFSYNDASLIDRILLDRIHRVKFNYLSIQEKLVIVRKYILPETYQQMGLENIIQFDDNVIEFIIEEYTNEPGVRKLKQIMFDIIGEINLEILKDDESYTPPIQITKESILTKYLKQYTPYEPQCIGSKSEIGVINGLWANAMGNGGIIPIQVRYFITNTFHELKLTGMQGDVMKESMNVAKTLACSLAQKSGITKEMGKNKIQGIHIHCPEGAVPKDGPSAGAAITTAIYSVLNNKKINHEYGITGEINLQGNVTKIGGLDLKFIGGIRGGVKHFLFPEENKKDYLDFLDKNKDKDLIKNITFTPVSTIHDVLERILV